MVPDTPRCARRDLRRGKPRLARSGVDEPARPPHLRQLDLLVVGCVPLARRAARLPVVHGDESVGPAPEGACRLADRRARDLERRSSTSTHYAVTVKVPEPEPTPLLTVTVCETCDEFE